MRVLMFSTDRNETNAESAVTKRQRAYAERLGHIDDIVLCGSDNVRLDTGTFVALPTNSTTRLMRLFDALKIAKTLQKPDVVTVQDPFETGFVGWLVARKCKVPLHVQIHTDFLSPEYATLSFLNRVRVWIAGFVLRRASRVRVVSERIGESVAKKYALRAPVSVLPVFVDIAKFSHIPRLKHPRFKISLLVLSRLEPEKNIPLAIRALREARASGHDAGLTIAGDGTQRSILASLARSLGLERFVEFVGRQDAAVALQTADILLFPSRYDGYGMAVVEALAAGVPVLATDVGVARESGSMVASPAQFAKTLLQWISSGPRTGELKNYPYKDFDEYVQKYCDDIAACARRQ